MLQPDLWQRPSRGRAAGIPAGLGRRDQLEGDGAADPSGTGREQSGSEESRSKPAAEKEANSVRLVPDSTSENGNTVNQFSWWTNL